MIRASIGGYQRPRAVGPYESAALTGPEHMAREHRESEHWDGLRLRPLDGAA